MPDNYSPVAIIEIDQKGHLLAINAAGVTLFSLSPELLKDTDSHHFYFDYYHHLNLDPNHPITHSDHSTIVINQQYYFLQLFHDIGKLVLVIQPVDYLKSCLSKKGIGNQTAFDVFCTNSLPMKRLIKQAKAFSKQKEPLLISGATGTGKDLLALACHQYSDRGQNAFLGLNCAAMPDEVVESELYGYANGAYPGTTEGKKGFFEQANGGSVLLDGIDEMSFRMQTKLIRFINDGSFRRVGDDNEVSVDVRIICITKVDLYSLVKQGKFREDLYYRLNVLPLEVPSVNERVEDIEGLTRFFTDQFANKQGIKAPEIDSDVYLYLSRYDWPGNVRELKNVLYSSLAQLSGNRLTINDITIPKGSNNLPILSHADFDGKTLEEMMKSFERDILAHLYQSYPSSRKLSKRLNLSHTAVANKLREYGINKE